MTGFSEALNLRYKHSRAGHYCFLTWHISRFKFLIGQLVSFGKKNIFANMKKQLTCCTKLWYLRKKSWTHSPALCYIISLLFRCKKISSPKNIALQSKIYFYKVAWSQSTQTQWGTNKIGFCIKGSVFLPKHTSTQKRLMQLIN